MGLKWKFKQQMECLCRDEPLRAKIPQSRLLIGFNLIFVLRFFFITWRLVCEELYSHIRAFLQHSRKGSILNPI